MKQRGHGALIRIASCFPSFSLVPLYPLVQPDLADAGTWGGARLLGARRCHGVRRVRRACWQPGGTARLLPFFEKQQMENILLPRASCSPLALRLLPSNSFYYM